MPTDRILSGIGRFQETRQQNLALFERLAAEGQAPEVLFIGCSDSRVIPETITGAEPGELFVTRNLGNIVPPYGTGEMAVGAAIEYAVLVLQVKHVIVCGHTDCGGIHALGEPADWSRKPHIARWVEHARPAKTKVDASGLPEEARHLATVRENVLLQLEHLRSYDPVRESERSGGLALHGWVYHLETGTIEQFDRERDRFAPLKPAE